MNKNEIIGMINAHRIDKKCFHPNADNGTCEGKIINAHTISISSSLKPLSNEGHVLCFHLDDNKIKEVGIKKASTFPGFCKKHDKEMFSPIENNDFQANECHSFLWGFRALTKDIYEKSKQVDLNEQYNLNHDYQRSCILGLNDLMSQKIKYDNAFKANDFSCSNYYILEFTNNSDLLFSGAVYPEYDFHGNFMQDINSIGRLDHISVNAINRYTGGCVIFQWMGKSDVNLRFVKSLHLLDDEIKANAITQFAFESFENLYMNPDWWESLSESLQQSLRVKLPCGYDKNHNSQCFKPDGKNYNSFKNIKIKTNVEI